MPSFARYVGIDYSGASTAESSLKEIRVHAATAAMEPREVNPPPSLRKYWSRREVAKWLVRELSSETPIIVGIDHAFSFPLTYFEKHRLPHDWSRFLNDFQHHCPTDQANTCVDFVRDGVAGSWRHCDGNPSWLRLTEQWTAAAKSVFLFDVQGAVAKATYAGLPWLLYVRRHCEERVHFWPFDGWDVPIGRSVVVEVYPSLWMKRFPREGRNGDQHAAYSVAAWLRRADLTSSLPQFFHPHLEPQERHAAEIEGWILGVV